MKKQKWGGFLEPVPYHYYGVFRFLQYFFWDSDTFKQNSELLSVPYFLWGVLFPGSGVAVLLTNDTKTAETLILPVH